MFENLLLIAKNFKYVIIIFVIIFFRFIVVNHFIYADFDYFVGNYLSIYQHAMTALQSSGIPMWAPHIFLGGNFLGLQNVYSIYSPFFLITFLFPSYMLADLFMPLLFLKTLLAGGALYLYMKETKWFSTLTINMALILYLFNGWYLNFLSQFVFIELMIYIPFVLFGIEYLLSRGFKRYLVLSLTLLMISHLSFLILFSPFLVLYIWSRCLFLSQKGAIHLNDKVRLLLFTLITAIGINLVIILPIILSSNAIRLEIQGNLNVETILSTLFRTFIPSLHESHPSQLSFINANNLALFQSTVIILLLPQLIKVCHKNARFFVIIGYTLLMGVTLTTQTLQIMNVTGIAPFNINALSLMLLLFNALMVAYVLNDVHAIDSKLLKTTIWGYKAFLTFIIGAGFLWESGVFTNGFNFPSFEIIKLGLITFSPHLFIFIIMLAVIDLYGYFLKVMTDEHTELRRKTVFAIIVIECILASLVYLRTHSYRTDGILSTLSDQNYVGNNTSAISNYLRAVDPNYHRLINRSQLHQNEPMQRDYAGFSVSNPNLLSSELAWMLDEVNEINTSDHFLTTALGAKYYLTLDSVATIPGYEYFDRIQGVTIFRNKYFSSIGINSEKYILASDFKLLTNEQKRYVFLQAVILSDEEAYYLSDNFNLTPFDISSIPTTIGEIQYIKGAAFRQTLGIENITFDHNRFSHEFVATEPSLLVYAIPYENGWRATANGDRLTIRQINKGFIGIEVPKAGEFEIVLEYRTPGILIGLVVSSVMVILIIGHFYKQQEEVNSKKVGEQ